MGLLWADVHMLGLFGGAALQGRGGLTLPGQTVERGGGPVACCVWCCILLLLPVSTTANLLAIFMVGAMWPKPAPELGQDNCACWWWEMDAGSGGRLVWVRCM